MLRRYALGALSVPLLLRQARGQDGTPAEAPGADRAENRAGQGIVSSQAPPVSPEQTELLGGMAFALGTAQLAERLGESPAIRAFGQLEAQEQAAFTEARQMAGLRVPSVELMSEQRRQAMIAMRDLRGPEFDRVFLRGQLEGHQELLRLHEGAQRNPVSPAEAMLAIVAVPAIRTHLVMLEGIRRGLGG